MPSQFIWHFRYANLAFIWQINQNIGVYKCTKRHIKCQMQIVCKKEKSPETLYFKRFRGMFGGAGAEGIEPPPKVLETLIKFLKSLVFTTFVAFAISNLAFIWHLDHWC